MTIYLLQAKMVWILRIFHNFTEKIIHILLGFRCDNKHTFGKQMPPDLVLLLFLSKM